MAFFLCALNCMNILRIQVAMVTNKLQKEQISSFNGKCIVECKDIVKSWENIQDSLSWVWPVKPLISLGSKIRAFDSCMKPRPLLDFKMCQLLYDISDRTGIFVGFVICLINLVTLWQCWNGRCTSSHELFGILQKLLWSVSPRVFCHSVSGLLRHRCRLPVTQS